MIASSANHSSVLVDSDKHYHTLGESSLVITTEDDDDDYSL